MRFAVSQATHRGGRPLNEDRAGHGHTRAAALLALADGMGGHPEGEVAARIAVQSVSALFQQQARPALPDVERFLAEALLAAHRQIGIYAGHRGMVDGPRTTLVLAVVQEGRVAWAHCGDSRLYWLRDGRLLARTRDHSYAERPEQAPSPAHAHNRNVLFTCLGAPVRPVFDTAPPQALRAGDRLLLCSDGLWDPLDDATVARHLGAGPVDEAVPRLAALALQRAGEHSDNVTLVAVEWQGDADAPDLPAAAAPQRPLLRAPVAVRTADLPEGAYATTIQAELPDPVPRADAGAPSEAVSPDELDEAEIERSIREIQDAIRRAAPRGG
ncbi:MAG: serine/threonine-protein phosphatase [Xylophilus ampelinus]